MAKKMTFVDKQLLKDCVVKSEENGALTNRSQLWEKVAELYNQKSKTPITSSIVYLRVKDWNINCITPKGKRGRGKLTEDQKAKMAAGRKGATRVSKAEQFHAKPEYKEHVLRLKDVTPKTFHNLVARATNGSRTAAQKLFCLQCVGFSRKDVRECNGKTCPMYLYRPYQSNDEDVLEEDEKTVEIS
jgi:hypothetical protein